MLPPMQTELDTLSIIGAGVACAFTLTRRWMLSGRHGIWHSARGWKQAALSVQAMFLGYVAILIFFGSHHPNLIETVSFTISAGVSVIMATHLDRYGRRPEFQSDHRRQNGLLTEAAIEARTVRTFQDERGRHPPPN